MKLKPGHPLIMRKDAKTIPPTKFDEKEMNELIESRRLGKIQQADYCFGFLRFS